MRTAATPRTAFSTATRSCSSTRSSRRSAPAWSTTAHARSFPSSTAGRCSRSTPRRSRTTTRSSTRKARSGSHAAGQQVPRTCRSTSPTTSAAPLYCGTSSRPAGRGPITSRPSSARRSTPGRTTTRTGREVVYVGYSPIIGVDADKILTDCPGARPARRPQSMVGVCGHEEAARAAVAGRLHARLDAQPVLRPALREDVPGPVAHRAGRGRDGRSARHARRAVLRSSASSEPTRSRRRPGTASRSRRSTRGGRSARRRRRPTGRRPRAVAEEQAEIRRAPGSTSRCSATPTSSSQRRGASRSSV